jgi:hypothetical protein
MRQRLFRIVQNCVISKPCRLHFEDDGFRNIVEHRINFELAAMLVMSRDIAAETPDQAG